MLRKKILHTEEDLQFLHCNAHFLLGLSTECEKILFKMEKEAGLPLGRDCFPMFRSFQNSAESSTLRYVRLACDCLGPRGDDKNSCRDAWEAYCFMVGRKSEISSFRGNRFNNLFQAAGALHYHRLDIANCLGSCLAAKNKKLESVYQDNLSEEIDNQIIALGLLYFRVTRPYWCLLNKGLHYLDFSAHVVKLFELMQLWSNDASSAFCENFQPLFGICVNTQSHIFSSLIHITEEKQQAVKQILQNICHGFLDVTRRQLSDFLPGGKYYDNQDPNLRNKMKHSKITNLLGESCFGDLDYSLFKRRNASVHHHSTVNILKRNKTISAWFSEKSEENKENLLSMSAKKAPALRQKHRQEERETTVQKQLLLEATRAKKLADEERKRQKIASVIHQIHSHDGPCSTSADVDRLLHMYGTLAERKKAVQAELQYHKLVLHIKSPLLKVTGQLQTLISNLKMLLGTSDNDTVAQKEYQGLDIPQRCPAKRKRSMPKPDDSDLSTDEAQSDATKGSDDDDGNCEVENWGLFLFYFQHVEEIIAVYYIEDYFIGKVVSVLSPEEAEVDFMEKAVLKQKRIFRWPAREDRAVINNDVVFASQLTLKPCSSSGRTFTVENNDLDKTYQSFKAYLSN